MKKNFTYEYENEDGDIEIWDIVYNIVHFDIELISCTHNGVEIDDTIVRENYHDISDKIHEHESDNEPDYYED